MNSLLKRTLLFCIALLIILIIYYIAISLSDSKRFSKNSLGYFLLTPSLLKDHPISDIYNEDYYYSAADGGKPNINAVTFFSKNAENIIHDEITGYLKLHNFIEKGENLFVKETQEVSIEYYQNKDTSTKVTLSIIE